MPPFCAFRGLLISITTCPVAFFSSLATLSRVAPLRSTPLAPIISSPCWRVPSIAASEPGTIPKMIVPLGPFSIFKPRPCPGIYVRNKDGFFLRESYLIQADFHSVRIARLVANDAEANSRAGFSQYFAGLIVSVSTDVDAIDRDDSITRS